MEKHRKRAKTPQAKAPISDTELFARISSLYRADPSAHVERTCEKLRVAFPEYGRKPAAAFRKLVAIVLVYLREHAPVVVLSDGDSAEREAAREMDRDMDDDDDDDDGNDNDDGNSGADASAERAPRASLNATLRRTYAQQQSKAGKQISAAPAVAAAPVGPMYSDVGGIEHCLQDIRELIEHPIRHPELFRHLGVAPPTGVLLHGPPGCGKTLVAHAIANELGVPFIAISAPEIVSGFSGQSEKRLRALFAEARAKAPCLVFMDEIDAITPKRDSAQREMERRIVAQLLTCMDELQSGPADGDADGARPHVLVLGATNRPDALDPALRRAGRFDREICLGVPDAAARARILRVLCARLRLDGAVDYAELARATPGFVGADLVALTREAALAAVNRIFAALLPAEDGPLMAAADGDAALDAALAGRARVSAHLRAAGPLSPQQLAGLAVTAADFRAALPRVQPSAQREGFTTAPAVTWADVGALEGVRAELQMSIVHAIRHPGAYAALGLAHPAGVLLYGPPGCGKTLLARAVAHECQAAFISVKGPELLNKYVGESERAVRQVFARARASAPCIVFFDEMDALAPRRGGESQASERVVNQLLTELDGLDARRDVFVVAATNRPDIVDAAMLRPGRLEKLLYVPLPSARDRVTILRTLTARRPRVAASVSVEAVALDARCDRFSGADLAALVREAALAALAELFADAPETGGDAARAQAAVHAASAELSLRHFEAAFARVSPSVSPADARRYEAMQRQLSANRMAPE